VVGGGVPRGVWAGGKAVPRVADAGAVEHGWHYDEMRGLLCLRVRDAQEYEEIAVTVGNMTKRRE